jgi:hypothetical protein
MNFKIRSVEGVRVWLKPHPNSDTAHYIVWRGGDELRTGCQKILDAKHAVHIRSGAVLCPGCLKDLVQKESRRNRAG